MGIRVCLFILALSLGSAAFAEYRVFVLKIEKRPAAPAPPEARYVESNLDPEQYRAYYPVAADEYITYVDTWRCRGRTDSQPFCPNPRGEIQNNDKPLISPQN